MFLATWKDIPNENEAQFQIKDCSLSAGGSEPSPGGSQGALKPPAGAEPFSVPPPDAASSKLQGSNIFTIAKRTVEGQDMLYQSLKLTNGIWVLAELRIQPSNPTLTVRPPHPPLPPPFP